MKTFKLTLEVDPGCKVAEACTVAQRIANVAVTPVEFQFNSVLCVAVPGGDAELLAERQQEASRAVPRVTSSDED